MQTIEKKSPLIQQIQLKWGENLEGLTYEQKIVFRAALTGYIAEKPVWKPHDFNISCIDSCIESAGVDWDVWERDDTLVKVIQHCSYMLSESQLEELIESLTTQIKNKLYASRSV